MLIISSVLCGMRGAVESMLQCVDIRTQLLSVVHVGVLGTDDGIFGSRLLQEWNELIHFVQENQRTNIVR